MNFREGRFRRGGAVAKFVFFIILLMIILSIARSVLLQLSPVPVNSLAIDQHQDDCGTGVLTTGDIKVKSAARSELSDPGFWALTVGDAKIAAQQLPKETVLGYLDNSQQMRDWVREHMQGPPEWLDTGVGSVILAQIVNIQVQATATHDATEAARQVLDFQASVAGYSLSALDYVTFGGISSLRTWFETGSFSAASCASFPAQLSQMYDLALNGNMSRADRAQLLAKALVITSVMLVLGGSDGFTAKFKGALDSAGLAASWDRIKPPLGKIGSAVSTHAAYLTTTLLEKLAQKFPGSPSWELGFVSDRVNAMAEVLHEKGISNDAIDEKIAGLVQATDNSTNPDDIATDADSISYDDGGSLRVKLGTTNGLYLYSDQDTMQEVTASFLEEKVPGFKVGQETSLKVFYLNKGLTVYHHYEGGRTWRATVPDAAGKPGDELSIHIEILTREEFVKLLPKSALTNDAGFTWLPNTAQVTSFTLSGDSLKIEVGQNPSVAGISNFIINGRASPSLGFAALVRSYLQFDVTDIFGQIRTMRVYHDGYSSPSFGLQSGDQFNKVSFFSADGVRLRVVYKSPILSVSTIYLGDPSTLYVPSDLVEKGLDFQLTGVSKVFQIDKVSLLRQVEQDMRDSSSNYPHGRLGAEIAYTVAGKLGIKGVVLQDPALGGADLFTKDGLVVIEARMLTDTDGAPMPQIRAELRDQLNQMLGRLNSDFGYYKSAKTGYAILSYLDAQGSIRTIVLQVLNS